MKASEDLCEHLLMLEVSLHRPEIRRERAALERLLAPEFTEFGRSGRIYDRRSVIDALAREDADPAAVPPLVSDVACMALSPDCALLTYRSARQTGGSSIETLRSSIWTRIDDQWCMVFHQGTPVHG